MSSENTNIIGNSHEHSVDFSYHCNSHDFIGLGEVLKALSASSKNNELKQNNFDHDEILRLPLFSRLLAASQLHACIPSKDDLYLMMNEKNDEVDKNHSKKKGPASMSTLLMKDSEQQNNLNETVFRLEAVAAAHPAAEGMDLLTNFLAPNACRKISKFSPLKRKRISSQSSHHDINEDCRGHYWKAWDTSALHNLCIDMEASAKSVGGNLIQEDAKKIHLRKKIKKSSETLSFREKRKLIHDDMNKGEDEGEDEDEDEEDEEEDEDIEKNDDDDDDANDDKDVKNDQKQPRKKLKFDIRKKNQSSKDMKLSDSPILAKPEAPPEANDEIKNDEQNESTSHSKASHFKSSLLFKSTSLEGDSQESATRKILIEVTQLVADSLHVPKQKTLSVTATSSTCNENVTKQGDNNYYRNEEIERSNLNEKESPTHAKLALDDHVGKKNENSEVNTSNALHDVWHNQQKEAGIALTTKSDSLLAEPSSSKSLSSFFSSNDVSAILPALMYHCPVLRYRHVANALCRASLPKTSIIIMAMAANDPSSIPGIIRGCLDAYEQASFFTTSTANSPVSSYSSILETVKSSIIKVSKLSKKEAVTIMNRLMEKRIMPDVFLQVGIKNNCNATLSALLADFLIWEKQNCNDVQNDEVASQSHLTSRLGAQHEQDGTSDARSSSQIQHLKQGEHLHRIRKIRRQFVDHKKMGQSWLVSSILQDVNLGADIRKCIVQSCLSSISIEKNDILKKNTYSTFSWGQIAMYVRVYALVIAHVGVGAGSSIKSGSRFVEDSMNCIAKFASLLEESTKKKFNNQDLPASNCGDSFYRLALCACLITCCRFPPIANAKQNFFMGGSATTSCLNCLSVLLTSSTSKQSIVFAARVAGFFISQDASELALLVWRQLIGKKENMITNASCDNIPFNDTDAYFNTCRWAFTKMGIEKLSEIRNRGVTEDVVLCDIFAMLDSIRRSQLNETLLNSLLKSILYDAHKCRLIFSKDGITRLIEAAVKMQSECSGTKLPLILPRDLETLAVRNNGFRFTSDNENIKQFILMLLYAFEFLEKMHDSPFIINPRILPIQEIMLFMHYEKRRVGGSDLKELILLDSRLQKLILKWCPELDITNWKNIQNHTIDPCVLFSDPSGLLSTTPHSKISLKTVQELFRKFIHNPETDLSGCKAEALFALAREQFHTSSVDTAFICVLLSSKHCPPPFFTYPVLYKDPLVLLKCSIFLWRMKGIRRIILSILQRLIEVNAGYIHQVSPCKKTAEELIGVRDLIISRNILVLASGSYVQDQQKADETLQVLCPMTIGFLRTLIAKRPGLTTMIIKQDIDVRAIDWLIEYVPEVLLDVRLLTLCIFERNFLATPERLAVADAGLRIAISHGARNETESVPLVYEALNCLVNSLPLVIGPIGVSVSALNEEGGEDVTQKCRRSTFRMLNTLQNITGKRDAVRNEASLALAKIALFCKNETVMSGATDPTVMKRKALLKEIWETVTRTANIIDNAMQNTKAI